MKDSIFNKLNAVDVSAKAKNKQGLMYLSWSNAFEIVNKIFNDVRYEVKKHPETHLPYFESGAGAMVYTSITLDGQTKEMMLPVMNNANKAMKSVPYEYNTRKGKQTVEAYTMFDINKTVMRCLVKNLAVFGLGINLYNGTDLPDIEEPTLLKELTQEQQEEIQNLIAETGTDINRLFAYFKVKEIKMLDYEKAKTMLEKKRDK